MSSTHSSGIWDGTSSPSIETLVVRYQVDWRSSPEFRPDPRNYLPDDPRQRRAGLVALLRADLTLRRAAAEPSPIESYRDRFPELDSELLVALLYEEYCLREEAGEAPEAAEYEVRFPRLAGSFQEVMVIHDLVDGLVLPGREGLARAVPGCPKPARRSRVCGWSRSWDEGHSLGFTWPRSSTWPIGPLPSR